MENVQRDLKAVESRYGEDVLELRHIVEPELVVETDANRQQSIEDCFARCVLCARSLGVISF